MGKDVIIACDFSSEGECLGFLSGFGELRPYVKIGMELFYASGPDMVRKLKERGHRIFIDLKLHDIPNTVGRCAAVLGKLGADMLNVHAAGGSAMMRAAREGIEKSGGGALLIAVTQLTSTSQKTLEEDLLIKLPVARVVEEYARRAKESGMDGVVCSPLEAQGVHASCGASFLTVTPGVRFSGGDAGDQSRIATPAGARERGADYIVVGRPITAAADPLAAYLRCVDGFVG